MRALVGFAPARLGLFRRAFSHKSASNRDGAAAANNERLEYLGDAVLGTIVAEYLFKKYPRADEGFLTKMRSKIVKRKSLNYIGEEMGLGDILRDRNRVRLSSSMLGNAIEALVGAVYLERGYARTERFVIERMLRPYLDMDALEHTDDNYKSQLLEACQKQGKTITYALVKKFKQERRDRFQVAVVIGGKEVAKADDFNKKAAEQLASLRALEKMGLADNLVVPRRKEKRSRAAKREAREVVAGTGVATAAGTAAAAGAAVAKTRHNAPAEAPPSPSTVGPPPTKPQSKTAKRRAAKKRGPFDYLVRHGVKTAVAGAAALEFLRGERALAPPPQELAKDTPKSVSTHGALGEAARDGVLAGAAVLSSERAPSSHSSDSVPKSKPAPGAAAPTKPKPRRRVPKYVREAAAVAAAGAALAGAAAVPSRPAAAAKAKATPARPKRRRRAVPKRTMEGIVRDGAAGLLAAGGLEDPVATSSLLEPIAR